MVGSTLNLLSASENSERPLDDRDKFKQVTPSSSWALGFAPDSKKQFKTIQATIFNCPEERVFPGHLLLLDQALILKVFLVVLNYHPRRMHSAVRMVELILFERKEI